MKFKKLTLKFNLTLVTLVPLILLFLPACIYAKGILYKDLHKFIPHVDTKVELINKIKQLSNNKAILDSLSFETIEGGSSQSKLYSFVIDERKYILKILSPYKDVLKRKVEIKTQATAFKYGIAPKVIFTDSKFFVIIMPFIYGNTLTNKDVKNKIILKKLGRALRILHNQPVNIYPERITKINLVKKLHKSNVRKKIHHPLVYKKLITSTFKNALGLETYKTACHGDLNPGNMILDRNNNLYLIDWSKARLDNPYTDLGWVTLFLKMNKSEIITLLTSYFNRAPKPQEIKNLYIGRKIIAMYWSTVLLRNANVKCLKSLENFSYIKPLIYLKDGFVFSKTASNSYNIKYALSFIKQIILDENK